MADDCEPLLFQTDFFVPFSKGTWNTILGVTLPAWSLAAPMGQTQGVTEKLMVTNH